MALKDAYKEGDQDVTEIPRRARHTAQLVQYRATCVLVKDLSKLDVL